jgi:AraC-like DNA-binding protein
MLNLTKAELRYLKKGRFDSVPNEGNRHVKVLPYLSIVQSVEGSYDIALGNGASETTEEGGFFIAPAGLRQTIVHHVNQASGNMSARWLFIDMRVNDTHSIDSLYRFPTVIKRRDASELNTLFDQLFATDSIWENYGDCYQLIAILLREALPVKQVESTSIRDTVAYIREHHSEPITVELLAKLSHMSESNFYTVFKQQMGTSPIAYLNHTRLSLAAERLIETTQSIRLISASVGISDALYFSKLFKKTYGISPKEYRRVYRA